VQQAGFSASALGYSFYHPKGEEILRGGKAKSAPVSIDSIRKMASKIAGDVITPEATEYDSARRVKNHAYDRHPAVIVRCAIRDDIARSLEFAQNNNLLLAVRCGGHSSAGFGVCDGGLLVDLAGMRRVKVDAAKRIVRAEAGCLVADVDQATQRFGLATVMGGCPSVGIGGLTLGGGIGSLTPMYGAACDNLDSAHVMTVDSKHLEANPTSNSDLFWAIRGGGGNFGVTTSFQYRLHPVTEFLAGALEYPAGELSELLRIYQKFTATATDEIMVVAMIEVDTVKVMSYLEAQTTEFPQPPKPSPFFETSVFLPELHERAIAAIAAAIQNAPPGMRVMMWQLHGAVTRIPIRDSAFPLREAGHVVQLRGDWNTPGEEVGARQWTKALRAVLDPFSRGMYVNHLSEPSDDYVKAAYGANYGRLVEIKKKYDPTNLLSLNPNIKPA
jgi:FAD/FMN-containing dehydrogenase